MVNTGQQATLAVILIMLLAAGCGTSTRSGIVTRTDTTMLDKARVLRDEPGLRFPFQDPSVIVEVRCFGLHPWSADGERHGGIDIIPRYQHLGKKEMEKHRIIAPEKAVVARIVRSTTGAGAPSLTVVLEYNQYWFGILTFEPQSLNEKVFEEQAESIKVKTGKVSKRDI